jgi:hypothetical protein
MKHLDIFRKATIICAAVWIMMLCFYSSSIIGAYIHERQHASNAIGLSAIEVNYDASGSTYAKKFIEDFEEHKWIYFNGYLVEVTLMSISFMSLLIILFSGDKNRPA